MIDINKKSDIIIPFEKISDPDWAVNTRIIIESLAENWNDELPASKTDAEISDLENRLGTTLPGELKLFYKTFGVAPIGEQLQEFSEMGWLEDIWKDAPQYGPDFTEEDNQSLPYLISFSDYLGNGNMFCFHSETKEIYYYDHDERPYITKLFTSFGDYLKGCLILCQSDLFGSGVEQQDVDEWTEEIVSEIFGEGVLDKWRY
ncbi:SMI1/KNR4 family protein [Dysgonomonas sp. 521]|uniref:SMI1/KNR4 family protein n=1 Tax=Dysgonomonas sp. 521 TaxID=2302932 RepID=UPI0013D72576|nr:SMI1/KNR4 family protein [Dysgonomonas sp. 521]NDV95426.1 SMI1/KNR4 family protein [Dysgonomonas sp. 521]